jgi:hypothetical protein
MSLIQNSEQVLFNLESPNTVICNSLIPIADEVERTVKVYLDYREEISNRNDGWIINEEIAKTIVFFKDTSERTVDFGVRVKVNGNSGNTFIFKPGEKYEIEIPRSAYSIIEEGATSEENLRELDPLYPFNGKYLVEGYKYSVSYIGSKVYSKLGPRCKVILERSGNIEVPENKYFLKKIEELNRFCIIVKTPAEGSLSEQSYLITYISSENLYDSIYVKAVLKTRDTRVSPILSSYQIKTGI